MFQFNKQIKLKEDKLWFNRHKSNNSNNSNIYFPEIFDELEAQSKLTTKTS